MTACRRNNGLLWIVISWNYWTNWLIHWVKVLYVPTWHKIGHFRDVFSANLDLYWKTTSKTIKANIHQKRKYTITQNTYKNIISTNFLSSVSNIILSEPVTKLQQATTAANENNRDDVTHLNSMRTQLYTVLFLVLPQSLLLMPSNETSVCECNAHYWPVYIKFTPAENVSASKQTICVIAIRPVCKDDLLVHQNGVSDWMAQKV